MPIKENPFNVVMGFSQKLGPLREKISKAEGVSEEMRKKVEQALNFFQKVMPILYKNPVPLSEIKEEGDSLIADIQRMIQGEVQEGLVQSLLLSRCDDIEKVKKKLMGGTQRNVFGQIDNQGFMYEVFQEMRKRYGKISEEGTSNGLTDTDTLDKLKDSFDDTK